MDSACPKNRVFCAFVVVVLFVIGVAQPTRANPLFDAGPTFQEIFNKHNTVMLLIDPTTGAIVDANPMASRFYGYPRSVLRTMTIQQINQLTPEQVAEERKLAETEGRNFFIFRHELANGEMRTVEVHSVPVDFAGRELLYSMIHDISKQRDLEDDLWHYQTRLEEMVDAQMTQLQGLYERNVLWMTAAIGALLALVVWLIVALIRQRKSENALRASEEQQRAVLNNTSSVVFIKDTEGRYLFVNKKCEELYGWTNAEMWGKTDYDLFPEDLADILRSNDQRAMRMEHPLETEEVVPHADGDRIYLSVKFPLYDATGGVYAVCGISTDITERKHAEELLRMTKEEAEQANRAKSEFLASMSHELRTPLNAVLGFAQLLQYDPQNPLSEAQNHHVDNILAGGSHLLELVNEILDLAKVEADQIDLSIEEVDANAIMDECLELADAIGAKRKMQVVDAVSRDVDSTLRTDRLRLKQVLLNLLSNAIKFNDDGGSVTLRSEPTADAFLRISVTDNGFGIAKEHYQSVFRMFHRLGADPSIARDGTGIGLTVTKLLVEQMGGRIGFDSELGKGSTFWVEMPLACNENVVIWTKAMSTNIDAIDKDHHVLMMLLNKIIDPLADADAITSVTEELLDYTQYHFHREEAIMEICNYPDLAHHRELHRALAGKVSELAQDWRDNRDPAMLRRLHKFLRVWLFDHIINQDAQITAYTAGKKRDISHALNVMSSIDGHKERAPAHDPN